MMGIKDLDKRLKDVNVVYVGIQYTSKSLLSAPAIFLLILLNFACDIAYVGFGLWRDFFCFHSKRQLRKPEIGMQAFAACNIQKYSFNHIASPIGIRIERLSFCISDKIL